MEMAVNEELIIRTFNCHHCKKLISITTVPDFIGFCNIGCAEKWKKAREETVNEFEFKLS
jgi:hypothetical protein